jgi:tetratricopeptide (TPR) repeat protein
MYSQEGRGGVKDNIERQFEYAESLFEEGDYYRAITEYKRYIFFFSEGEKTARCYFRIGESYFNAKKWTSAIDALKVFITRFPYSPMLNDAFYLKGMAEKNLKRYEDALSTLDKIIKTSSGEYRNKAIYQSALIFVDMGEWKKAGDTFLKIPKESLLFPAARNFSSGLEYIDNLPAKSPAIAGSLAAVVPGAGHLYTERPRDALVAFLLNGTFIWAAVELFDDEKYVAGGIVTFFELGWYSGNIYSAVSSTHKYNRRVKEEFLQNLKNRSFLSYYHDSKRSSNYLMLSMSF